jgi:hypothetical protein
VGMPGQRTVHHELAFEAADVQRHAAREPACPRALA